MSDSEYRIQITGHNEPAGKRVLNFQFSITNFQKKFKILNLKIFLKIENL